MKKQNGITLATLVITIVVLLIISVVTILNSTDSLESTRLKGFYTKLEFVQKRVDNIAATNERYIDSNGNTVYLKEQGLSYDELTDTQKSNLQNILQIENLTTIPMTNFRYFTSEQLDSILDLSEIEYNVFIDFDNRIVIAENGITVNGTTYYMLKNSTYFVEENTQKNVGNIEGLNYTVIKYGDEYKITIAPTNTVGDLNNTGTLKYKKSINKYWITAKNLEIVVEKEVEYDIIYEDVNKNSVTKKIKVILTEESVPNVTEINEEEK